MGLRLRIVLILTIPAVLVVAAHGILRVRQEEAQLFDEDRRNMALTARAVQIAIENALRDRQVSDVRRLLVAMVEQQDVIDRIRLFDADLRPVLVSNALAIGDAIPEADLRRVLRTDAPEAIVHAGAPGYLSYLVPLHGRHGVTQGAMEIVRLASAADARRRLAISDVVVRLTILVVVMVVVTTVAMQRQVLRPLSRLMEGIQGLGRGEPPLPVPVKHRDEIGRLAEAFNAMAVRLDSAQRRLLAETERTVALQQQLRRAATLAVAGRLASALAHEVGTPLNIISGRAEFVLKSPGLDPTARQDLEIVVAQIDRISGIIGSLLDTVRAQAPEPQPTAFADVLEPLLPLLRHSARQRDVALTTGVPADLPPMLVDSGRMQQVLINLVLNAIEATPAGGRVRVTAAAAAHEGRPGVSITVADTGPGIPPALAGRVFEPFFTTKPRGAGTGLGLAICRDIVREHGGDIRFEPAPEGGTAFVVWMPEAGEARA